MNKLLTIYGSSRRNGNTETLTKILLEEIPKEYYHEVHLLDYHIEPIFDQRHEPSGFEETDDDYNELIKSFFNYEAFLFVTPLYWYSMSGRLKNLFDRFTQSMRNDTYDFKSEMKGKKIYVVIVGGPSAPVTALPLVQQFQLISQFLEMEFKGYLIGRGSKPQEVLEDENAVVSAKLLAGQIRQDLGMTDPIS